MGGVGEAIVRRIFGVSLRDAIDIYSLILDQDSLETWETAGFTDMPKTEEEERGLKQKENNRGANLGAGDKRHNRR